ncbi:hypothetical protein B0H10DRAFT_907131 [Mycena sp. CBHHK59/15]|nr:hypothetical protein B0H10DRAFT_907131 [Mycena sp. CBHHK59/15]
MTEYDYSPEAYHQYMATQSRIQDWASTTADAQPYHPDTPPTPGVTTLMEMQGGMGPYEDKALKYRPQPGSPDFVPPSRPRTAPPKDSMIYRQPSANPAQYTPPVPPLPPMPQTQIYNHTSQTNTPYGSQYSVTVQTTNGVYVQQKTYQQTTQPLVPQRRVPSSQTYPMQGYPPQTYPAHHYPDHTYAPAPGPPPQQRIRAQSSAAPAHAPVVPTQMSNGIYAAPSRSYHASVQSLAPPPQAMHPSAAQSGYDTAPRETRRAKSSATLRSQHSAAHSRVAQDVPPVLGSQNQQYYTLPRASKSSATLHSKSSSKRSRRHEEAGMPMNEFGEAAQRTARPFPGASQMHRHALIPIATYETPSVSGYAKAKPQPLIKRIFSNVTGSKKRD